MEQNKNKKNNQQKNAYDDGNIPDTDLPGGEDSSKSEPAAEPLPESFRPRKDGPGGN